MKARFALLLALVLLPNQGAGQSESPPPKSAKATGLELFGLGRLKEAIPELQKSLQTNANDAEVRLHLAFAYDRVGQTREALSEYRHVIEQDPRSYFAHNNLAVLYDKQGLYDEAIAEFQIAVKLDPQNTAAKKNLETATKNRATIQERQERINLAEQAARTDPRNPTLSYNVARLHASVGNRRLALEWLGRALRQGYKDIESVRTDPSFQKLRDDRDFELLLIGK